jgi:hypothetical protein
MNEDVHKMETLYTVGETVLKNSWQLFKQWNINLLYDLPIPFLEIYVYKNICLYKHLYKKC